MNYHGRLFLPGMTAVMDCVLTEAGVDDHRYLPCTFVKLSKVRSELCVSTYQRYSHSLDPGGWLGTLKICFLTVVEWRAWRVLDGLVEGDVVARKGQVHHIDGCRWC